MKKLFATLFLILSINFCYALTASEELNTFLAPMQTMTANFQQQTFGQNNQLLMTSRGTMILKKPNQFLWKTTSPNQQTLVTDRNNIMIYDADLMQATRQSLDLNDTVNPAQLLSGDSQEILQQFSVAKTDNNTFRLTPNNKKSQFRWLEFSFNNGKLKTMRVLNALDQLNVIRFSNVNLNTPLSAAQFKLALPKGTAIIDNTQGSR